MSTTELVLMGVLALLLMLTSGFWLWMLIECLTREPDTGNTKLGWTLVIVLTHFVGALIYFFTRRNRRLAEVGR